MNTPICDFVEGYRQSGTVRLHMPGHKGVGSLGMEQLDITELSGADSLYEANGIIRQSEEQAAALFGAPTFYATEGSSQCIRAMLYLAVLHAKGQGRAPVIAAARNVHRTFLSAAALLDLQVQWLYPRGQGSYLSCPLEAHDLEEALRRGKPTAVYVTSPDYLGNVLPLEELAQVCHRHGCLLLVDCAHGAYLRFLQSSRYPTDLGADVCCSSAHKTLPVLTGGAYLHLGPTAPAVFTQQARDALALFGSTSPSYLTLQSLDAANAYLADGYRARLQAFCARVAALKERLDYALVGDEPLKLTLCPKSRGYTGDALGEHLRSRGLECEFSDPDHLVLMLTPENTPEELVLLEQVLSELPRREALTEAAPAFHRCEAVCSVRQAMLSPSETVPAREAVGRVLAAASVGCPPAVPIVVCGERIDEAAAACFAYYGIESCRVIKGGELCDL